ncbi:hypothetical protein DPMN_019203 [Dreissena polymorpha]|uniref:Uncharacterized protein n=1 Tax=Dreissena polymorpha TaxID=45954 RepID=A0A9D4NI04_DREPO|nr:hypothetical protein DPMN_019203 [Dreissena polymorpha]
MIGTHRRAALLIPVALLPLPDEHHWSVVPPEALETDLMPGRAANDASSRI